MNLAYPYQFSPLGRTADATDAQHIRDLIEQVLFTIPGERVMRPDFGCRIHEMVFDVINAGTGNAITEAVRDALAIWEPRIDVLDLFVVPDAAVTRRLLIEINYQVRQTNSRFNLVYPFYLA